MTQNFDLSLAQVILETLQKRTPPGIWSQGVQLSKTARIETTQKSPTEGLFLVLPPDRPTAWKVSLWLDEEDVHCSCPGFARGEDTCAHVIAALLSLKHPMTQKTSTKIHYHLRLHTPGFVALNRTLVHGDDVFPINQSLSALLTQTDKPRPTANESDVWLDRFFTTLKPTAIQAANLPPGPWILLDGEALGRAWKGLQEVPLYFEDKRLEISSMPVAFTLQVKPANEGHIKIEDQSALSWIPLPGEFGIRCQEEKKTLCKKQSHSPALELALKRLEPLRSPVPLDLALWENIQSLTRQGALDTSAMPKVTIQPASLDLAIHSGASPEEIYVTARLAPPNSPWTLIKDTPSLVRTLKDLGLTVDVPLKLEGLAASSCLEGLKACALSPASHETLTHWSTSEHAPLALHQDASGQWQLGPFSGDQSRRLVETGALFDKGTWWKMPPLSTRNIELLREILADKHPSPLKVIPAILSLQESGHSVELPPHLSLLRRGIDSKIAPLPPLPTDLTATLRDYQKQGIAWLHAWRALSMPGVLLADDMGLGKTLQILSLIQGHTLAVLPQSLLTNWQDEAAKFRPGLKIYIFHGSSRREEDLITFLNTHPQALILTTYGIVRANPDALARDWDFVIADEAQVLRNETTLTMKAMKQLRGAFHLALSGTPIENRQEDAWSLFDWLIPDVRELFKNDLSLLKPFLLRRTKAQVLPELPEKTEQTLEVTLSPQEREHYDALMVQSQSAVQKQLAGEGYSPLQTLEWILRLRQTCSGVNEHSSKFEAFFEHLESALAGAGKILVFSQWTSTLDRLEEALEARDFISSEAWVRLDGSTQNRGAVLQQFKQDPKVRIFFLSLKAGSVGLNLTQAQTVYLMDPWWNPAVEAQAMDRVHRIGQKAPVFIYRMIVKDSIEEGILALSRSKKELLDQLLTDTSAHDKLTKQELLSLLAL